MNTDATLAELNHTLEVLETMQTDWVAMEVTEQSEEAAIKATRLDVLKAIQRIALRTALDYRIEEVRDEHGTVAALVQIQKPGAATNKAEWECAKCKHWQENEDTDGFGLCTNVGAECFGRRMFIGAACKRFEAARASALPEQCCAACDCWTAHDADLKSGRCTNAQSVYYRATNMAPSDVCPAFKAQSASSQLTPEQAQQAADDKARTQ